MARVFIVMLCCACGTVSPSPNLPEQTETPTLTAETLSLSGPCVVPEEREYIVEVDGREANSDNDIEPQRLSIHTQHLDVDGDGIADALVPSLMPGRCVHEVDYAIYVMRGECGYHVGRVTGRVSFAPGSDAPPGVLRNLVTTRRWPEIPAGPMGPENVVTLHTVSTSWLVRNDRYFLGNSDVSEGICHHCSILTCRTLVGPSPRVVPCEPLPREDDLCEGHGFCPITWGEPGGHSSALWCRNGRWMIEDESNEP